MEKGVNMVVLDCEIPLVSVNEKYIVARGRMILSQKYRDCKNEIALRCQCVKEDCTKVNIYVTTYKDADNICKIVVDAIAAKCLGNDRELIELHVYKTKAKRGSMDKIKVEVY